MTVKNTTKKSKYVFYKTTGKKVLKKLVKAGATFQVPSGSTVVYNARDKAINMANKKHKKQLTPSIKVTIP